MEHAIFNSTPHWLFTVQDRLAEQYFQELQEETRRRLPPAFYGRTPLATQPSP
jgi:hypothetical protein